MIIERDVGVMTEMTECPNCGDPGPSETLPLSAWLLNRRRWIRNIMGPAAVGRILYTVLSEAEYYLREEGLPFEDYLRVVRGVLGEADRKLEKIQRGEAEGLVGRFVEREADE